jgi:hypothetical protein
MWAANEVLADTVYRVVGSDGRISYSDKNPNAGSGTPQSVAEQIEIKENYSNKTSITQVGSVSYCGTVALPVRDITSTNYYAQVVINKKNWAAEIMRIDGAMSQMVRGSHTRYSGPGGYTVENINRLSELNCAVDWSQKQKLKALDEKIALQKKSEGLDTYLQELKMGMQDVCGDEPIYSSTDRLFDDRRDTWKKCVSGHNGKMGEVQADLRRTDQQLLDIKLIEEMP